MDYSLLKNKIYLTLLAYYNNEKIPSFVKLGNKVGVTRQTASSRVKELTTSKLVVVDDNNNIFVENPLNIDVKKLRCYLDATTDFDPVELKILLFPPLEGEEVIKTKLAQDLGISRASLYLDKHSVVYAICSEGRIKYIGTTKHYEDRIAQHIKNRPFLTPANFIILVDDVSKNGFNIELDLIHLLKPEWNEVGAE